MALFGVPLLVIPFLIYNAIAFLMPDWQWAEPLPPVHIVSGGEWAMSSGDILVAVSILILFVELVKSTRVGMRTIIVHMLAAVLFAAMLVEFLLVKQAATATFFLLLLLSFVDMLAGFTISIRTAQRNIEIDSPDKIVS
jgi:hypothetical protein